MKQRHCKFCNALLVRKIWGKKIEYKARFLAREYCDRQCRVDHGRALNLEKRANQSKICKYCGKEFFWPPGRHISAWRVQEFCGRPCSIYHNRGQAKPKPEPKITPKDEQAISRRDGRDLFLRPLAGTIDHEIMVGKPAPKRAATLAEAEGM